MVLPFYFDKLFISFSLLYTSPVTRLVNPLDIEWTFIFILVSLAISVNNSKEVFEIYWNYQKKPMEEDVYEDRDRTLNFPYLIDMHQWENHHAEYNFLEIPERYHTEWYYSGIGSESQKEINNPNLPERIWDLQSYTFWKLIPVSTETPYDDVISHMPYEYDQFHNHLAKDLQWASAIASNLIGDAYANLTVNPLQWK